MSAQVAAAVAEGVREWSSTRPVEVVWHCGEPLLTGPKQLAALFDEFAGLNVRHGLQTNATLIDDEWCELFKAYDVDIGVSVDGPGESNSQRVNLAGRPSLDSVLRGVETLKKHGIPFAVLAVVSDPSPNRARELYNFGVEIGAASMGVLMEALAGVNQHAPAQTPQAVEEFWGALAETWQANPVLQVRELQNVLAFAAFALEDNPHSHVSPRFDPLPTVAWNGDVYLLSPEFVGFSDDRLGPFSCGNVLHSQLSDLVSTGVEMPWVQEYLRGVSQCQKTCSYFSFCGGGFVDSRYFEHRRLDVTKTHACQNSKISLIEGVMKNVHKNRPISATDPG